MSDKDKALEILKLLDLTSLSGNETAQDIAELCQRAKSAAGETAALCIYSEHLPAARNQLSRMAPTGITLATVVNFPAGGNDIVTVEAETEVALKRGADEIDLVFPYRALMNGNEKIGAEMVSHCKKVCGNAPLKVIIESGELGRGDLIERATQIAIHAGADFIKTSTGKVPVNATLEAAKVILTTIRDTNPNVGFKASGGISDLSTAIAYMALAKEICGEHWVDRNHFRFGASSLLTDLLTVLGVEQNLPSSGGY